MTANEALNDYFKTIAVRDRAALTRDLLVKLEITPITLSNWRYSRTRIKPVFQREISKIIGKDIFANITN